MACQTCDMIRGLLMAQGLSNDVAAPIAALAAPVEAIVVKKAKRKVSKYSKQFGKEMKKLIAKHPRSGVTKLMKRAHTATRKALK